VRRGGRAAGSRRAAFAVALALLALGAPVAAPKAVAAPGAPGAGGDAAPWQAADAIRADLFEAQTQLLLDERSGDALAAAGRHVAGLFARDMARVAPAASRELRGALQSAERALADGDEIGLAAARGSAIAALRRGAFAVAVVATERGDTRTARAWLLVRDFRQSTRFTRPGVDATAALLALEAGESDRAAAALAVRKDLLDAYQSRLSTNLDAAAQAGERDFGPRFAEAAALAAGYWSILAPEYGEQRGAAAARATARDFAALARAAAANRVGAFEIARERIERDLQGFTAAPFTEEEQARRAGQLTRFLDLIPIEYGDGTEDGRVTIPFELQEAVAFHEGVEQAFADLQSVLAARDPEAVAAVQRDLDQLAGYVEDAHERVAVVPEDEVEAVHERVSDRLDRLFPADWKDGGDAVDYDLVEISIDQLVAAANAGEWDQAEQARLSAYAFFEFGPEPELRAFDPALVVDVEGLFWYGARDSEGLAALISSRAPTSEVRESTLELGDALDEARAKTGEGASATTTIVNAALIVFREGLEAILIIAAITASMIGARRRLRRPIYRGALLALPASVLGYVAAVAVLGSLQRYGEKVEAVVGLLAVGVLLLVLNWFFHKVYWTEWIAGHRKRGKELTGAVAAGAAAGSATVAGLYVLGFTSVFREGMETVLFLQALQLASGTAIVIAGVALGLAGTALVGLATFKLEQKLPYKRMLIVTGVLIAFVLFVMTGNTARSMQGVGWLEVHSLDIDFPLWIGTWLGVYPTMETLGAQLLAVAFVIGSYFAAEYYRKNKARPTLLGGPSSGQVARGSGGASPRDHSSSGQVARGSGGASPRDHPASAASSSAIAGEATTKPNGSPGSGTTEAPASVAISEPAAQSQACSPRS
jgi:high-affinity iron transporter